MPAMLPAYSPAKARVPAPTSVCSVAPLCIIAIIGRVWAMVQLSIATRLQLLALCGPVIATGPIMGPIGKIPRKSHRGISQRISGESRLPESLTRRSRPLRAAIAPRWVSSRWQPPVTCSASGSALPDSLWLHPCVLQF